MSDRLSIDEIINQKFNTVLFQKGYNIKEVDDYLDKIIVELEYLHNQISSLNKQSEKTYLDNKGDPVNDPVLDKIDISSISMEGLSVLHMKIIGEIAKRSIERS